MPNYGEPGFPSQYWNTAHHAALPPKTREICERFYPAGSLDKSGGGRQDVERVGLLVRNVYFVYSILTVGEDPSGVFQCVSSLLFVMRCTRVIVCLVITFILAIIKRHLTIVFFVKKFL